MKLKIAFLQLLPVGSARENLEKGLEACLVDKGEIKPIDDTKILQTVCNLTSSVV